MHADIGKKQAEMTRWYVRKALRRQRIVSTIQISKKGLSSCVRAFQSILIACLSRGMLCECLYAALRSKYLHLSQRQGGREARRQARQGGREAERYGGKRGREAGRQRGREAWRQGVREASDASEAG
jgi:hypothetical protein